MTFLEDLAILAVALAALALATFALAAVTGVSIGAATLTLFGTLAVCSLAGLIYVVTR
jgi:hypothetical protein